MKKIVVSFRADEDQKKLLNKMFKGIAYLKLLKDFDKSQHNDLVKDSEILFAWNPERELKGVEKHSFNNLEFIQLLSAGYDHVDLNTFPHPCRIASNKGAYAEPMAEHIMAMILAFYKRLFINHLKLSKGEFDHKTTNRTLKNSICGILGLGGIGKAASNLLKAFGAKIYAINSSGKTDEEINFIGTLNELEYVLTSSDVIIISLPLNNKTLGLIDKNKLELMKPDAVLINAARGEIINQEDLFKHLKLHPEFCAGLDVQWVEPFLSGEFKIDFPFFELPNFLGSPHNSAMVPGIFLEGTEKAAENILNYLTGNNFNFIKQKV